MSYLRILFALLFTIVSQNVFSQFTNRTRVVGLNTTVGVLGSADHSNRYNNFSTQFLSYFGISNNAKSLSGLQFGINYNYFYSNGFSYSAYGYLIGYSANRYFPLKDNRFGWLCTLNISAERIYHLNRFTNYSLFSIKPGVYFFISNRILVEINTLDVFISSTWGSKDFNYGIGSKGGTFNLGIKYLFQ